MLISYRLGTGQCVTIIDTPGTGDTQGRDYKHAIDMIGVLKNDIQSFEAFLLLFKGIPFYKLYGCM